MAIKSGNSAEALVLITDTTLLSPTTGRGVITSLILSEQTGAGETIELFISTNASSVAAERIETITLSANESTEPLSMPDRGIPDGSYLIAKGTTGSIVTAYLTYTQYSGAS
jgi:hypothetical protein